MVPGISGRRRVGRTALLLVVGGALLLAPPARGQAARLPKLRAVNKVYEHGIARNFKVIKKATA